MVSKSEEADNILASGNYTELDFCVFQHGDGFDSAFCFPYFLPNLSAFKENLTYSALVLESGNLGLAVVLPSACYINTDRSK